MAIARGRQGHREIYQRLGVPSLGDQISEAWAFQCHCAARLWIPLLAVCGVFLVVFPLLSLVTYLVYQLSLLVHGPYFLWDPLSFPLLGQVSFFLAIFTVGFASALSIHLAFVVVQRCRRKGWYPWRMFARDFGLACERTFHWGTMLWSLIMVLLLVIQIFAGVTVFHLLSEQLHPRVAAGVTLLGAMVIFGLIFFAPLSLQFAVLVRRDCGWDRAWEAAFEIWRLEGWGGVVKSVWGCGMLLSVIGAPGAIALLLATVERLDILLSAVLNEKTRSEVEKVLHEEEIWTNAALQPSFTLMEKGRYLDALNGFQQYLFRHPMDVEAIKGQALAYLHMGHPKAREALERWATDDPESEEAATILEEFNSGMWAEGGTRLVEAERRCTQRLGRGV